MNRSEILNFCKQAFTLKFRVLSISFTSAPSDDE
jgi:hypothetical protein